MGKYFVIATALKMFSVSSQTRALYRLLGNIIGAKRRVKCGLPKSRLERAKSLLELLDKHSVVHDGDKLLEVGTGWVHWESVFIRLFYDVEIVLFDVWDNRQFEPLKRWCVELRETIAKRGFFEPVGSKQIELLERIALVTSFDDLYNLLGFEYVIEPDGALDSFSEKSFDLIFSCNVLEHIKRERLLGCSQDIYRLLKPQGYSVHTIDMGDHLSYYDPSVSVKNYLRYSERTWKWWFENDVQYFNRVQRPEWLRLFSGAGLDLVCEKLERVDLEKFPVDEMYKSLGTRDLECVKLKVVHRKPF